METVLKGMRWHPNRSPTRLSAIFYDVVLLIKCKMATSNQRKRLQRENQAVLDSWLCKKSKSSSEEVYDEDATGEDGKNRSCSLTESVTAASS